MSAKIKHAFLVFFLAALVCRGASAQQPAAPTPPVLPEPIKPVQVRAQRRMMSTTIAVTVVAESDAACREHIGWVFARLKSLEKELNAFDPESDVARVNAKAATEPVAVSDDVFRAIQAGVEWHKRTRGDFRHHGRPAHATVARRGDARLDADAGGIAARRWLSSAPIG